MPEPTNFQSPDDEHYYFGVELPYSPEEVRERLLRKPEYLYSLTSVDEEEGWNTGPGSTCGDAMRGGK